MQTGRASAFCFWCKSSFPFLPLFKQNGQNKILHFSLYHLSPNQTYFDGLEMEEGYTAANTHTSKYALQAICLDALIYMKM